MLRVGEAINSIRGSALLISLWAIALVSSCDEPTPEVIRENGITPLSPGSLGLTEEELLDPNSCQPCHPDHYDEWSRSVHAHSSTSPVFLALNELGQRESEGELGSFCVQCHAPVALALGETTDGLNLSSLPSRSQGITCAYCHQISEVNGTHNNPLTWSRDGVMRGRLARPLTSGGHRSMYSPLHDGRERDSSDLCGACHDIVTPTGVHLERTYLEWSESVFAERARARANSCIDCHMPSRLTSQIALGSSRPTGERRHHNHLMPGVDLVLPSAHREELAEQRARYPSDRAIELRDEVELELGFSLISELCAEVGPEGGADVEVYLENISAGHRFPSGAALDRRLWAELQAFNQRGELVFSSGVVEVHTPSVEVERNDPFMWLLRDRALNAAGEETHRFWEIKEVIRNTLPAPTLPQLSGADRMTSFEEPHVLRRYRFSSESPIREIHLAVYMRPIGLELLYELSELGLLESEVIDQMPTYELTTARQVWRLEESLPRFTLSGRELLCTPL